MKTAAPEGYLVPIAADQAVDSRGKIFRKTAKAVQRWNKCEDKKRIEKLSKIKKGETILLAIRKKLDKVYVFAPGGTLISTATCAQKGKNTLMFVHKARVFLGTLRREGAALFRRVT